jgi:hypothetical protein
MRREVSLRGDGNGLLVVGYLPSSMGERERKRERSEGRQTHFWRESSSGANEASDSSKHARVHSVESVARGFTDSGFN